MRVLVTGGTGFVGSHTVAALERAGHQVRLLVRNPERVSRALEPVGGRTEDIAVGDVTDKDAVARAVKDCDAVVHAASVYSLHPRDWGSMRRINVRGTEVVLEAAANAGCDPIVHVSSSVAILPGQRGGTMDERSEPTPGEPPGVYTRTKIDSEVVARRFQQRGAPVVTTYPGAVFGPHDPYLGESNHRLMLVLRGLMPMLPTGGIHACDVREVAAVHAALMERGRGPRRYVVPGHFLPSRDENRHLARLTGRHIFAVTLPTALMMPMMAASELLLRAVRLRYPSTREAIFIVDREGRANTQRAEHDLGVRARPLDETLSDTARWLVTAGHIRPHQAGRLAQTLSAIA